MQGTTPSITIAIDTDDFLISDVTALEFYVKNGGQTTTYDITDNTIAIDTETNTITKTFTENETKAFSVAHPVKIQARFWFADGSIVGIKRLSYNVSDMIGVGD